MKTESPTDPVRTRLTAVLFTAQSFFSASTIAAFTLSPIIAAALSGSDTAAGVPNTLTLFGRAAFAYPLGYMMDRFGRRLALSAGYGFAILGGLISIFAIINNSYLGFLLGALLFGMARSASDQSRYVAAEAYPLRQRARIIGFIVFAGTIGAIGGPLLVDPSTAWSVSLGFAANAGPFVIATAAMLIATLIVFLFLRPDPLEIGRAVAAQERLDDPDSVEHNTRDRSLLEIFSAPRVQLAIFAMVISYFVMAFLMVITPLHMNHHDHNTADISMVIMAHTLGMFGLSWLTGWLIDRFGRERMILAGAIVLILACILAPLSLAVPILGLALFMLGLGWNFSFVAGSSLLSDALASAERGRAQGASEAIVAIAAGSASFSVGFAFQQGDYLLVSAIGLAFCLALVAAIFVLGRRTTQLETAVAAD